MTVAPAPHMPQGTAAPDALATAAGPQGMASGLIQDEGLAAVDTGLRPPCPMPDPRPAASFGRRRAPRPRPSAPAAWPLRPSGAAAWG